MFFRPLVAAFAGLLTITAASATTISSTGQGPVNLATAFGANQLSDIAFDPLTGRWFAVGDNSNALFELDVQVDSSSGQITSANVINTAALNNLANAPFAGNRDFEGLDIAPDGSLYISGEQGPQLYRYNNTGGAALSITSASDDAQLSRFNAIRGNLGWEAVAVGAGRVWLANEEALSTDGPTAVDASPESTLVRIQALTSATLTGIAQWAYAVDPIPAGVTGVNSGLVSLLALPNGELLALERTAIQGFPPFSNRIYRVDFTVGEQVQNIAMLDDTVATVGKELLWQGAFLNANFEGMTLGQPLDNGDLSLILISDNGGSPFFAQSLQSLRLTPSAATLVPAPASLILLASGGLLLLVRKRSG